MSTEPLTVVRQRLSEIVDEVATTGSELVITLHGRPKAVILGHDEYESLVETLNILSDPATMDAIEKSEEAVAAGDLVDFD
jgi:prevent-host-death family protein